MVIQSSVTPVPKLEVTNTVDIRLVCRRRCLFTRTQSFDPSTPKESMCYQQGSSIFLPRVAIHESLRGRKVAAVVEKSATSHHGYVFDRAILSRYLQAT